jgi:hypothetical protein
MNARFLRPDFVVALLAIVIGLCTMFVYIYQARIMARQMEATTWPFLSTNLSTGTVGFIVTVNNKGIGPAMVKKAAVIVDNQRYEDTHANIDSLVRKLTLHSNLLNGYTNINDRVISAGESVRFFEVTDSASAIILQKALQGHTIQIEICYCSVLRDCWTLAGGKTEECDGCE